MRSQAAGFSISAMRRVLEVSRSGFYARAARLPSARAIEDAQVDDHNQAGLGRGGGPLN